jgi:uncharacterized protein (TIGR03083 family)
LETVDEGREVARLRRQFADRIESLDETAWFSASWCEGWLVRDVLAHLVQNAERTYTSLTLDLLRAGFRPDRAMSNAAKRLRPVPVPELADRLRRAAERSFHLPGNPEGMSLVDVLVHSADALRPIGGRDLEAPAVDAALALSALCKTGRVVVHAAPHKGCRLVATDIAWDRGSGPEVRGNAMDLLLLVANRRQVLPNLEGPGLAALQAG